MGFLKNMFKKKAGGTAFGNLLRAGSSIATSGILGGGANRIELGETKTNIELSKSSTFGGKDSTVLKDGTIAISEHLPEVSVNAIKSKSKGLEILLEKIGDSASYLGKRASEDVEFGADNKTLYVIGGGIALLAVIIYSKT